MKKIVMLCGSPRKDGNTNTVAGWVRDAARTAGGTVETVDVTGLKYRVLGCTACDGCQRSERFECVIDDEASLRLATLPRADVIVIVTPVYFFGPSAQLKVFLDRAYSLFKFRPDGEVVSALRGRRIGLIATSGGPPEDGLAAVEKTFRTLADFIGGSFLSLLVPNAPKDPAGLAGMDDLKRRAAEFGREIAF